jgi:putative endonuclease
VVSNAGDFDATTVYFYDGWKIIETVPLTRGLVRAALADVMAYYAYILRCADDRLYYGSTNDLLRRLREHRAGRVRTTACRLPVGLVYFEEQPTAEQARQREHSFKNGRTRRKRIEQLIADFPAAQLAPFA